MAKKRKGVTMRKRGGDVERRMVIGAITSDAYLRRVAHVYRPNVVENAYVATIMRWCMMYYEKYKRAPKREIEDIYHAEVRKGLDADQADMIGDLLESVSAEYEEGEVLNVEYLLDKTRDMLAARGAEMLAEEIKSGVVSGHIDEVEAAISNYKRVELAYGDSINPFTDADEVFTAFEETQEPLIRLPGAFGDMMNEELTRDSFIGIMGPEKRGKTWMLMEFAFAGIRARRNVAFFSVGDMSKDQMTRRMHVRLAGKSYLSRYCDARLVPVLDCVHNQSNRCKLKYRRGACGLGFDPDEEGYDYDRAPKAYTACSECQRSKRNRRRYEGSFWMERVRKVKPLSWREGLRLGRRLFKGARSDSFRLVCEPNSSVSVSDLSARLDVWEAAHGFVPDLVVIDYADILAAEPHAPNEERHRQNETWKALRRLSQQRHCLVVTATQSDAKAFEQETQTERNFSEDKRKYGHVTGMIGLNQTREEKDRGVMRINWVVRREGEFNVLREVKLLQCLQRGRPHIGSFV